MNYTKIKVGLIDDHALFRSGIANLLEEFEDIDVVFEAANGKELQQLLPAYPDTDVLLMDIKMPVMDGYSAVAWVKEKYSYIRILALSMFDDDIAVIRMLKAGAGGYVLKESKPAELYKAITEIKDRGFYSNEIVSGKLIRSLQQDLERTGSSEADSLTSREKAFLCSIALQNSTIKKSPKN